ncbi:unnamed protein product [Prunus armeniaca]
MSAGAVGKYGQLEQLRVAKRGVLHEPKGRKKLHSINRELHTHSIGSQTHTFTLSIILIHTFRFTTREKRASCKGGRAWSCPGNSLLPSSSSSPLFILSMYLIFCIHSYV